MSAPQSAEALVRAERAAMWLQHSRDESSPAMVARPGSWIRLGMALAAAVVVALIFVALPEPPSAMAPAALVQRSGSIRAELLVQQGERWVAYRDGMQLQANDRVSLRLHSSSGGFLTVVRHGHGGLSTGYDAVSVPGGPVVVPGSLRIDPASGGEVWYVLLAADRVSARDYQTLLTAGRTPPVHVDVIRLNMASANESRTTP